MEINKIKGVGDGILRAPDGRARGRWGWDRFVVWHSALG